MMQSIKIEFLAEQNVTAEINQQIDELDHLAFSSDAPEEKDELTKIKWASHDWMALGYLNEQLVTQLCLLKRKINVGNSSFYVVGVGGVATHPQMQKQGYSSALLLRTNKFIQEVMEAPFGLLICDNKLIEFYSKNGWHKVAESLWYIQDGQPQELVCAVLIIPLQDQDWPSGEIDLCGLPW